MKNFKITVSSFVLGSILAAACVQAAEKPATGAKNQKLKPYPLKTCVVTGEKLGEMGDPYVYEYKDREIKFCCKGCLKDFNKEPAKYVKKIEAAEKSAKEGKSATPPASQKH